MPSWIWHCLSHFALCVISSVCLLIRPLLKEPVPKLTSLIYLSFMAVNDAIAFFLFFFFHLPREHFFFPPFLQFNGSCIHGWTENVSPLNLGPNFYTQNVFLSLSVSLIYLCEITSCNIWLWECQRFFLVVWFFITVSLLPFSPSYVQWMYFSMH